MFLKSFNASVHIYRKYLLAAGNNVAVSYNYKSSSVRSYTHCSSILSKHTTYSHFNHTISKITCHKCQVQRRYSRGILDGDILDLQNAQKERELTHVATLFPNPRVTLNEFAAKCPQSVFDVHYKQTSVAPKGARKRIVQNDWTCMYAFVWPQKIKFESTAKSKRQAAEKAALQALHWLHINKRIDRKGHPVFDKSVLEDLNSSLQEPIKASITETSMERISRIWEDYENEIREIYTATFKAAAHRAVTTPTVFTKDSTIEEEDGISEDSVLAEEADTSAESKVPVHPVYGRHVSSPSETALDRRKRQLARTFRIYEEERTPLPIDEYGAHCVDGRFRRHKVTVFIEIESALTFNHGNWCYVMALVTFTDLMIGLIGSEVWLWVKVLDIFRLE